MIKCPDCGKEIKETDKRCPYCGYVMGEAKSEDTTDKKSSQTKIIAVVAVILIIAVVGVLASGMFSSNSTSDGSTVNHDEEVVKPQVDSADSKNTTSSDETPSEYWASAKTDKFHLPDCEWAEKISDDNKIIYQSREDAIADGKEPCSVCNP